MGISGKRACLLRWLGAIASGLITAVLLPPFNASYLVWIALIPLLAVLWSIDGKRAGWKGFGYAWVAGTIAFLIQLSWLSIVTSAGAVALPMYLGCFWGFFGAFAATMGNPWKNRGQTGLNLGGPVRGLLLAFSTAAVWAGFEYLRGAIGLEFGWNGMGVAFHQNLIMAQAADLFGVAGLSLLVVFFQAVVLQTGRRIIKNGPKDGVADLSVTALILGLVVSYGIWKLAEKPGESVRLKALLVQLNIPQEAARVLWDALDVHLGYEEETLAALKKIDPAGPDWPDWVVWPETALTGRIVKTDTGEWGTWQENTRTISRVREAGPFTLIFGATELEGELLPDNQLQVKPDGRYFNSMAFMSPEDDLQTFRKNHLVMFGETIPFVDSIPLLKRIYEQQSGAKYGGSFSEGGSFEPMIIEIEGKPVGVIPSVCFEDSVPALNRKFVKPGAQLIVNVTNDGWFKESPAAAMHFANSRFRAIELRRPMLRCANTGVSAAVDSKGSTAHPVTGVSQILTDSFGNHFTRGSLLTELEVPLNPPTSLYVRIGDYGIVVLFITGIFAAFCTRRREILAAK